MWCLSHVSSFTYADLARSISDEDWNTASFILHKYVGDVSSIYPSQASMSALRKADRELKTLAHTDEKTQQTLACLSLLHHISESARGALEKQKVHSQLMT